MTEKTDFRREYRSSHTHRQDAPRQIDPYHSYSSQELFRGAQEIAIEHQGASYRLRITRTGGLILNK